MDPDDPREPGPEVGNGEAPAGEIDLLATGAETIGCAAGDLGRYGWSRSADGLFLTLTLVDDTCANRAAALARTWVHSLSAVNDGGTGVFPIAGWLKATLPSMRWALDDTGLHSFDATDPAISFVVMTDPLGYDQPCGAGGRGPVPGGLGGGRRVRHGIRRLPPHPARVRRDGANAQVGGHQAAHVVLTPKPSFDCPGGSYALFHDGNERDVVPGQPHSLWIVNTGGAHLCHRVRG